MLRSFSPVVLVAAFLTWSVGAWSEESQLKSLPPDSVLSKLGLSLPELAAVKEMVNQGDRTGALEALRAYYREKYPLPDKRPRMDAADLQRSGDVVNHIFQWGPYEPADYGEDVDWTWDPRGDIEWVAAIYRFYWAEPLVKAYLATGDDKYVRAFVELTTDWIAKHPLEERDVTHYVYDHWRGYPWLDIQTGIRATRICQAFPVLVHGDAFTPEFLGVLLASLYDHQQKTLLEPMGVVHNKAVFEQRGFVNIAYTFPEFAESQDWLRAALPRMTENFLAQVTPDGVQREWSGGYHTGVLRDAVEIMERMEERGVDVPPEYRARVQAMYDYIFAIATPELAFPMFGDTSRDQDAGPNRPGWQLYSELMQASALFDEPRYAARATLDKDALPEQTNYAFSDAGMYVMRDQWGPEQIYFALHCSPPAISSHDQPDNGTFELCAYGRWLMPDSGYYTYGHDPAARSWHRRTAVHQTLTLAGKDSAVAGIQRLWQSSSEGTALVVENQSYPDLLHRRSVWFVDKRFFVVLDEAIGEAAGALDLHFQFAPGDVEVQSETNSAATRFDDVNVLVWQGGAAPVTLHTEEGWFAWSYGKRLARQAVRFHHDSNAAPAYFLTMLVPYLGTAVPEVTATMEPVFAAGNEAVSVTVTCFDSSWTLSRDLAAGSARIAVGP